MGKIPLDKRKEATKQIILFMLSKNLPPDELIRQTYNNAIEDVIEAIDTYIKHNPQFTTSYLALQKELEWMLLPDKDE